MRIKLLTSILCIMLLMILFGGCSMEDSTKNVKLTKEHYPVNRVHVSEISDGTVILTVAYMETGTGAMQGSQIFVGVRGYAVQDNVFLGIGRNYHKDWHGNCVSVDLENMSDEELREVLR